MAGRTSRDKRLKLYRLGNTRCPICLVQFTEEAVRKGLDVTLEHAPPKTLGGQEVCLTCQLCNSRAGATSDQAVKKSKGPPELLLDVNGAKRSARFWPEGIPPSRMPYRFGSGPAAKEAQRELSKETIVAVTSPIQFDQPTTIREVSVSLKKPNSRHVELSYLRSAYLLVFSLLGRSGYVFAQSEALRLICAQIRNPNDEVRPSLVRAFTSKSLTGNVITLRNNERPFFWSARFDDGICVFLPYGGSEKQHRQIVELPEEQKIRGWEWKPRKFGDTSVDRCRLPGQSNPSDDDLFGREYVTVSNDWCKQRWIVVNEVGDALQAGPKRRPSIGPPGRCSTQESEGFTPRGADPEVGGP